MKRLFWAIAFMVGAVVVLNEIENSPQTMRASKAANNYSRWIGRTVIISPDPEWDHGLTRVGLYDPMDINLPKFVSPCRAVLEDYIREKDVWIIHVLDGEAAGMTSELRALTAFRFTPVR